MHARIASCQHLILHLRIPTPEAPVPSLMESQGPHHQHGMVAEPRVLGTVADGPLACWHYPQFHFISPCSPSYEATRGTSQRQWLQPQPLTEGLLAPHTTTPLWWLRGWHPPYQLTPPHTICHRPDSLSTPPLHFTAELRVSDLRSGKSWPSPSRTHTNG
jgi:hypothetical protein